MNINQILNTSAAFPVPLTSSLKRKADSVTSEAELKALSSPSSRRKTRSSLKKSTSIPSKIVVRGKGKGSMKETSIAPASPKFHQTPLSFHNMGRIMQSPIQVPHSIDSRPTVKPHSPPTSKLFISLTSSKTPLARPLRVLSRHIRHSVQDSDALISLTRIPSIMDVYLDAKSPSIDFTEEVLSEIAVRSRRLANGLALASNWPFHSHSPTLNSHSASCRQYRLLSDLSDVPLSPVGYVSSGVSGLSLSGEEEILFGGNDPLPGNFTQHPDSFERSTATWSEGLNGQ
ncbi:hypothetical protein GYMLUDRAFT_792366 [Collybiopsis luxurians FD-317 M1]|nr:hypothetical protein GYMLUDRAFT_792366 [Collybiopsis luxurians FD-317 M1]